MKIPQELFRMTATKARTFNQPYVDDIIDELGAMVLEVRERLYLGSQDCMGKHLEYVFLAGNGKAAVVVRGEEEGRENSYSFLEFEVDAEGRGSLIGLHSTLIPTHLERFKGKMGSVAGDFEKSRKPLDFIAAGTLADVLSADLNSGTN